MKLSTNEVILYKFLTNFIKQNQNQIIINLPISIDSKFYNNKNILLKFFQLIKKLALNGINYTNEKDKIKKNFKVSEIQLDIGDTLNRHNFYFWDINNYMLEKKINKYEDISPKIRESLKQQTYKKSKQEGINWFINNLDIINELIPIQHPLNENFQLNNEKTILFKGNENYPKITYIRHEHWLNNKEYKTILKALKRACTETDSKIENVFNVEATYFYNKVIKNKSFEIADKNFFINNAEEYLKDEAVDFTLLYRNNPNVLEFYLGWENNFSQAFRGKKMKRDKIMQKYFQNELIEADQRKFIPVKIVENDEENKNKPTKKGVKS